ncbi:hypothetical protein OPKNFCMD_1260 [Methylobacterium crusticola]|uniref:Uncharacterized protein n=1 Tax=Methylobacterium crusticola TaxID=1697972 RepID=A0ABQ4QT91_9HYPH|nr:hypothetical protein [Methylobacterium crusticola]GJD48538.1 hypothetical protein OPKNFCMD_1260 [Methylobacterium crusticola]
MRARPGARLPLLALLALAAGLTLAGGAQNPAAAAPAVDKAPAKTSGRAPARDVTTTASATAEDADDANCTTSRKRLWLDGEGWIVRRVTTCR